MNIKHKRLTGILVATILLLAVPFIGMQFTNEIKWSGFDFIVAGALLLGTGLAIEFICRKEKKLNRRIGICIAIIALLVIVWAELAVGIFNSPFAGN